MQSLVKDFNDKNGRSSSPLECEERLMDIQSEVGELAKEYLKATNYGQNKFVLTEDFEFELGDVLYSVLSLAEEQNVDAKNSLLKVLNKYQERIDKKKNMGSGK